MVCSKNADGTFSKRFEYITVQNNDLLESIGIKFESNQCLKYLISEIFNDQKSKAFRSSNKLKSSGTDDSNGGTFEGSNGVSSR